MVRANPVSITFDPNIFVTSAVNLINSSTKDGSSTVSKINSCAPLKPVAIVQGPVTVPVNAESFIALATALHASMYKGNLPLLSGWGTEIPQIDYFSFHPAYEFHSLIPNDLP